MPNVFAYCRARSPGPLRADAPYPIVVAAARAVDSRRGFIAQVRKGGDSAPSEQKREPNIDTKPVSISTIIARVRPRLANENERLLVRDGGAHYVIVDDRSAQVVERDDIEALAREVGARSKRETVSD